MATTTARAAGPRGTPASHSWRAARCRRTRPRPDSATCGPTPKRRTAGPPREPRQPGSEDREDRLCRDHPPVRIGSARIAGNSGSCGLTCCPRSSTGTSAGGGRPCGTAGRPRRELVGDVEIAVATEAEHAQQVLRSVGRDACTVVACARGCRIDAPPGHQQIRARAASRSLGGGGGHSQPHFRRSFFFFFFF